MIRAILAGCILLSSAAAASTTSPSAVCRASLDGFYGESYLRAEMPNSALTDQETMNKWLDAREEGYKYLRLDWRRRGAREGYSAQVMDEVCNAQLIAYVEGSLAALSKVQLVTTGR